MGQDEIAFYPAPFFLQLIVTNKYIEKVDLKL